VQKRKKKEKKRKKKKKKRKKKRKKKKKKRKKLRERLEKKKKKKKEMKKKKEKKERRKKKKKKKEKKKGNALPTCTASGEQEWFQTEQWYGHWRRCDSGVRLPRRGRLLETQGLSGHWATKKVEWEHLQVRFVRLSHGFPASKRASVRTLAASNRPSPVRPSPVRRMHKGSLSVGQRFDKCGPGNSL